MAEVMSNLKRPTRRSRRWFDRFWEKILIGDDCWEWLGSTEKGYGKFTLPGNKCRAAHRIVYELTYGPIPEGLTLDHLCYNRKCVKPTHLEPCSREENTSRANKRNR